MPKHSFFREVLPEDGAADDGDLLSDGGAVADGDGDGDLLSDDGAGADGDGDLLGDIFPFAEVQ